MDDDFYIEVVERIKKEKPSKQELARLKNKLCRKYMLNKIPLDIDILLNANPLDINKIKQFLLTKPIRTISGVAIVAIMTKPSKCPHGKCIMCPGGVNSEFGTVPQSYTGKEPATRRAVRNKFDPYLQVMNRLEQYVVSGHVPDKAELIIMGGTFPSVSKRYRENFVKYSLKAMNDFSKLFFVNKKFDIIKFKDFFELPGNINDKLRERRIHKKLLSIKKIRLDRLIIKNTLNKKDIKRSDEEISLESEQANNEKSNIKCIGLTIETRPDYGMLKHGNEMLRLGATRVELGVQSVYDDALRIIERGHSVYDSIKSTRVLKDLGFKINYHVMPGLPDVSKEKDLEGLKKLFSDSDFRPDMLKIYPCMVLKGTKLYSEWKKGKFKPLNTRDAALLISEFKKYVPEYVRIMRVQRDIPTFMIEEGVDKTNLRQYISKIAEKCRCIRCREIKDGKVGKIRIKIIEYDASKGKEFFIAAESNDKIVGFCRLRFPSKLLRKEITKNSALVRELHVLGPAVPIGLKGKVQHKGIGKRLLLEAEKTAKDYKKNKIIVISGIGAREYYRKLGYKKEGPYMVKKLK